MNFKNTDAEETTITRNLVELENLSGNVYQSIVVIARRSDQISVEIKEELNRKLADFASFTDNLEEIFENREQIQISKFYESLPKAVNIAIKEFLDEETYFKVLKKNKRFGKNK